MAPEITSTAWSDITEKYSKPPVIKTVVEIIVANERINVNIKTDPS